MKDPFFLPQIPALTRAVQPLADSLGLATLPFHVHEVLGAALLYTFIQVVVSPRLSLALFPNHYPKDSRGKKANWDSHVVSLFQSVLINCLALWVMFVDEERKGMSWQQRVWEYDGACGMVQSLAAGYFVWDFLMTVAYLDVFGIAMLAHATSALAVFSFGFRPFLNYYSCVFILYELSTPFLNIHWFCDKLQLTGSKIQLYNGICLLVTFFSCRLAWGTAQSARVYYDMWRAVTALPDAALLADNTATRIPLWLVAIYTASNVVLNCLNWHWFFKMIVAVRKRFEPVEAEKTSTADTGHLANGSGAEAKTLDGLRKRRGTIENLVEELQPDSQELRDGSIQ